MTGADRSVCFVVESGTDTRLVEGLATRVRLTVLARGIPGGRAISQPTDHEVTVAAPGRVAFAWRVFRTILRVAFRRRAGAGLRRRGARRQSGRAAPARSMLDARMQSGRGVLRDAPAGRLPLLSARPRRDSPARPDQRHRGPGLRGAEPAPRGGGSPVRYAAPGSRHPGVRSRPPALLGAALAERPPAGARPAGRRRHHLQQQPGRAGERRADPDRCVRDPGAGGARCPPAEPERWLS